MRYEEQVLDAADARTGLLSQHLANRLLFDHGTAMYRLRQDGYKGHERNAAELLDWLGY
jgi:hypothetical protein